MRRYSNLRQRPGTNNSTLNANDTLAPGGINEQQLSGNFEMLEMASITETQPDIQSFHAIGLLSGRPPSYSDVSNLSGIPPPSYEEAIRALPKSRLSHETDEPCVMNSHYTVV